MRLIRFILSIKGIKAILFNILSISLCHYILFNLFGVDKSANSIILTIVLFLIYWIGGNIYFFTGNFKVWVYCTLAIFAPFEILSLTKWILLKWHFLAIDSVSKIDVNFLGWAAIYFFVSILIINIIFLPKRIKKEKSGYSYSDRRHFFWDNPLSVILTVLMGIFLFLFIVGTASSIYHKSKEFIRWHHNYYRYDNCGC